MKPKVIFLLLFYLNKGGCDGDSHIYVYIPSSIHSSIIPHKEKSVTFSIDLFV